ncbi:MAG: helix-turn-helix domain-containing protein [Sellimonas intestinalis]
MNKTNRLKEIRVNRNISVSQLSREAEISERYLRFIESGEKPFIKDCKEDS